MFAFLSTKMYKTLHNVTRINGQKTPYGRDWAWVTIHSSVDENRLIVDARNNDVKFTQRIGGLIESDGQVFIGNPKDLKKWLPKGDVRVDYIPDLASSSGEFRYGESTFKRDRLLEPFPRLEHIENPVQVLALHPHELWDVLENARKYGDIDSPHDTSHYVHFRVEADGHGEYITHDEYAFFKGKIYFLGADAPCEFSLHIEALEAVLMAIKDGKHFSTTEILLHVKDGGATIETGNILCSSAGCIARLNVFKMFDELWATHTKDVEFVWTNNTPANKYKKNDPSYWTGDGWETGGDVRPLPKNAIKRIYIPEYLHYYAVGLKSPVFTIKSDECWVVASIYVCD